MIAKPGARPVRVIGGLDDPLTPGGSLLVGDWGTGIIYRVTEHA